MNLVLHGGFGEKGRTCIGVESGDYRVLLDAGVKTSARGRADYYPAISREALSATHAVVFTHGHEDHVAALGWCIANGFAGRILMTGETHREMDASLESYATPAEHALALRATVEPLLPAGAPITLGPFHMTTGRSGHIAGGVWLLLDDGRTRFAYCGDVVPSSPVFAMDPLPQSDVIALDASYADDDVPASRRAAEIAAWVAAHPGGSVLPTPLFGRSAELLAIVPGQVALAPGMRDALATQLADTGWLVEAAASMLAQRLARATDWNDGDALPRAALICHDGMGMAGPSREILAAARATGRPTLFTGHVPAGSAGAAMVDAQCADWIRLPTHPTLRENAAMVAQSGARIVLGHSCDAAALVRLAAHLPALRRDAATGDRLAV